MLLSHAVPPAYYATARPRQTPGALALVDLLDRLELEPPPATRGVHVLPSPIRDFYRYAVVTGDGRTIAHGHIAASEFTPETQALFTLFLDQRDPQMTGPLRLVG